MERRTNRRDPMKSKHWRWVRFYLNTLGMWPKAYVGEPRSKALEYYNKFAVVQTFGALYLQIHYIWSHRATTSFFELGHILITVFLNILSNVRLQLGFDKMYGPMFKTFFNKIHLFNYEYANEYSRKLTDKIERISLYISIYYISVLHIGIPFFNVIPWLNNYNNGAYNRDSNVTLQSSIYLANPFDTEHNLNQWVLLAAYDLYFSSVISTAVVAKDLCLFLMIFQIMGNILILENNLKTMARPALQEDCRITYEGHLNKVQVEMFSEEENSDIHEKLKRHIEQQTLIQSFTHQLFERYGMIFLVTYMFHMVNGCIILLEIAPGKTEAFVQYGLLAASLFGQLITLSMILEQLYTLSDRLGDAVYSTPWECMDTRNQKTVLLFLMRVQTPKVFKAKGLVEIGVKPMASILKTTMSYFAFLKSMNLN
uniref:Odorant receptor n=1 Tax=Lampronia capitella TaxID=485574 RepID=A0A2Z4EY23_9NEOP|nr:odorant receptor 4 [Lampronia capitella]